MAWVREKHPKRKARAPERDPKEALEGLLSYLACKPSPNANIQRYLREESPPKRKPEVVQREPTVYDEEVEDEEERIEREDEEEREDDYEPAPLQNQKRRNHHHPHATSQRTWTPAPRHVSNVETRQYRPRTNVQTRRIMSSWSNATTPLAI
jgi:hypothetical protein